MNYCPNCGYCLGGLNTIPNTPSYPPLTPSYIATCQNTGECNMPKPHSHLVAGKEFPCEK